MRIANLKMCWEAKTTRHLSDFERADLGSDLELGERDKTQMYFEGSALLIIFQKIFFNELEKREKFNPRVREIMNIMNIP